MIRVTVSYSDNDNIEGYISDSKKHEHHRIMHISKEYKKGKSPYRKIHIDLSNK